MKIPLTKAAISTVLGVAITALGLKLLLSQIEPVKPYDYLSFLTGFAAFSFSLYQVFQEASAKENQQRVLLGLLYSANENISRVRQFSLRQDPSKNVSDILVGVLAGC